MVLVVDVLVELVLVLDEVVVLDGYLLLLVKLIVWLPNLIVTPLALPRVMTSVLEPLAIETFPVSLADKVLASLLVPSTLTVV